METLTTEQFAQHMRDDKQFQDEQRTMNKDAATFRAETEGSLAKLHAKIELLATKGDIKDMKSFMENVSVGVGIFRFSWNNASKIGSFVVLIGGVILLIKYGVAGALAWLFSNNH